MREIIPGIIWIKEPLVAPVYLIRDTLPSPSCQSWTMIDSGLRLEYPLILSALELKKIHVSRILLTHSHPDHAGNAELVMKQFGCNVYCSTEEQPFLTGQKKLKPRNYDDTNWFGKIVEVADRLTPNPVLPNALAFKENPELARDFDFILLPGHTPGTTVIRHRPSMSIFLGDALINCDPLSITRPEGLHVPYTCFSEDRPTALRNLGKLHSLDFENAFFGHGPPLLRNAKSIIVTFLQNEKIT